MVRVLPRTLGIAAEFALPEFLADDHGLGMVLRLGSFEDAAEDGLRAEQGEEVRGQILDVQRAGLAKPGDAGGVVLAEQADVVEDVILGAPVHVFGDRRGIAEFGVAGRRLPQDHQILRLGVGQRLVEQSVEYAENGAVGRDAQR